MSSKAIEAFSTFGVGILCFAVGIMALAIFFSGLSWLGTRGAKPDALAVRGILKKDTWATVHLSGAETFERVRFIGFTSAESMKTRLPPDLNGMVILEDPDGKRFLVRAKAIRMIVITPEPKSGGVTDQKG